MNKSQLRANVMATGSYFFDRATMKFFGDTMANYGTYGTTIGGRAVIALYRKRPVKYGLQSIAYFDAVTFEQVYKPTEGVKE